MKIGIVINGFYRTDKLLWQVEELRKYVLECADCEVYTTNKIIAFINGTGISTIVDCDAVIYLDKDIHVAKMLEGKGIRLFNSSSAIAVTDDKMLTHIAMSGLVKMPVTISSPLNYTLHDDNTVVETIEGHIKYPVIIKQCHGSFGSQVYKADNIDELLAIRARLLALPHIYQEFIKSSCGHDMRLIVIGGRVVAAMDRINGGDFRSNIELGGVGHNLKNVDARFVAMAEKTATVLRMDYAGVDLLYGNDGEPILCEINSNAYFNAISKISGINIAQLYVEYIFTQLKYGK